MINEVIFELCICIFNLWVGGYCSYVVLFDILYIFIIFYNGIIGDNGNDPESIGLRKLNVNAVLMLLTLTIINTI